MGSVFGVRGLEFQDALVVSRTTSLRLTVPIDRGVYISVRVVWRGGAGVTGLGGIGECSRCSTVCSVEACALPSASTSMGSSSPSNLTRRVDGLDGRCRLGASGDAKNRGGLFKVTGGDVGSANSQHFVAKY